MGEEFGPHSEAIGRWLAQRASYAAEEVRVRATPPAAPAPVRPVGPDRVPTAEAAYAARAIEMVFPPRTGTRRLLGCALAGMAAGAAAAAYVAVREQTAAAYAAAGVLVALLLVMWGVRAARQSTRVVVRRGHLEVTRGSRREVVDLASPRTPIAVVGRPESRHWRVLIERPGEPLLVVDRSMVDPQAFTDVLYRVHPELWSDPGATVEPWQLR